MKTSKAKINQLIPEDSTGFLKNISELMEEHRNDNIQCLMLCYRRKDEGSTRTFFIGANDPHMFMTLVRLEHDMLGLYSIEAEVQEHKE